MVEVGKEYLKWILKGVGCDGVDAIWLAVDREA
jgi:hypothetical protein